MRLVITIEGGKELLTPLHKGEEAIFRHCSGGLDAITWEHLRDTVAPLLEIHGISDIIVPFVSK